MSALEELFYLEGYRLLIKIKKIPMTIRHLKFNVPHADGMMKKIY
jgi:hypothetical protein